jgi:hypothetical protein
MHKSSVYRGAKVRVGWWYRTGPHKTTRAPGDFLNRRSCVQVASGAPPFQARTAPIAECFRNGRNLPTIAR